MKIPPISNLQTITGKLKNDTDSADRLKFYDSSWQFKVLILQVQSGDQRPL